MSVDAVDDIAEFQLAARAFLEEHAKRRTADEAFAWGRGSDRVAYFSSEPLEVQAAAVKEARGWQHTRFENGFGWITGPVEYGGRALTSLHEVVYDKLEAEYDVPDMSALSLIGLGMIGPTILAHGTAKLRDTFLPAMFSGESIACQLFSEPAAGSDLAAVKTRAVRDGDAWVLNGQKVWTSLAQHADIGMALCRTDLDAPKHKGITCFLVDMHAAGVDVRPLRQMTGGADFNEVFLTDVHVPDARRLGEVNAGWSVTVTTLMNERSSLGEDVGGPVSDALTLERLSALMRATWTWDDRALRRDLAGLMVDLLAVRHLGERSMRLLEQGATPGPEASIGKLASTAAVTRAAHFVSDVLGPRITADTGEWGTFAWAELLLATPALRILGGTEEIMKNILAERVLGLPKDVRV